MTQTFDSKAVKERIERIVTLLEEADGLRNDINEYFSELEQKFGVSKKIARRVATMMHKKNKEDVDTEQAMIDDLYQKVK